MKSLLADLDILMCVAGWQSIEQIQKEGRDYLESHPRGMGMIAEKSRL